MTGAAATSAAELGLDRLLHVVAREEPGDPLHHALPPPVVVLLQHVDESSLICWHQLGLQKSNCENAVQSSSLWRQIRSLHSAQPQPSILSPGKCRVGLRLQPTIC